MSGAVIRLLPPHVIDHIAAGEVVERPASVVKELVENALDAGATDVQVALEGGGLHHLMVTDNGSGMAPEQARLSLLRHATSKLTCSEDLFNIATLGFRGEALSSIASVSRMHLVTRPADAATGWEIRVEGGTIVREGAVGSPFGTRIVVDDLFFNTPARRKFMRAPATEQTHVVEAIRRVFLGARRGGVCVRHGRRRLLDVPEDMGPERRVQFLPGRQVDALAAFEARAGEVLVTGYVGLGPSERADGRNLWVFVNGRFVRDRYLARAAVEALAQSGGGMAPALVVAWIELPPALVDVNVHPQKLEVRFSEGRDVFTALAAGVIQGAQQLAAGAPAMLRKPTAAGSALPPSVATEAPQQGDTRRYMAYPRETCTSLAPESPPAADGLTKGHPWPLGGGYFMCKAREQNFVVHWPTLARHQAMALWQQEARQGPPRRHELLLPEILEGRAPWADWLSEAHGQLLAYGFDITPVGPGRFLIRAVPEALLCGQADKTALLFVKAAYAQRRRLHDGGAETTLALLVPGMTALEVKGADDVVAAYLEDTQWTGMGADQGVVRVTPPVLRTLFHARA